MPCKKKATPGTVQFNTLAAEIPENQENIKAQVQIRHDLLEPQKGLITRMSLIGCEVLKNHQD